MAVGFYGQSIYDSNRRINEMIMIDKHWTAYSPPMQAVKWENTVVDCYCKPIPDELQKYYRQLIDYHKQAGYKPQECEKICCSLKHLGVKY